MTSHEFDSKKPCSEVQESSKKAKSTSGLPNALSVFNVTTRGKQVPQPRHVLSLQRLIGNKATRRLLTQHIQRRQVADPINPGAGSIKEIDEMRANLQTVFQVRIPQLDTDDLLKEAKTLNTRLFQPKSEVGPREKSSIAETLLKMHKEMNKRLAAAPVNNHGLPVLTGVNWKKDDPLAGVIEAVDPFGMVDWWSAFIQKPEQQKTKQQKPSAPKKHSKPAPKPTPKKPTTTPPISAPDLPEPVGQGLGKSTKPPSNIDQFKDKLPGIVIDIILDIMPIIGLIKTAFDTLTGWINALQSGARISIRDIAIRVYPDAIASMAVKIADKPDAKIPSPDDDVIRLILQKWHKQFSANPSLDKITLDAGRKKGLKLAKRFIDSIEKKKHGKGVLYLRWLKQQHKGSRVDIYRYIFQELKKRGIRLSTDKSD